MTADASQASDRFLRLKEVQAMLGVSRTTVWRWHAERGLKVVTIGGVTRIRKSDLEAFLRRHETQHNTTGSVVEVTPGTAGPSVDLSHAPAAEPTPGAL